MKKLFSTSRLTCAPSFFIDRRKKKYIEFRIQYFKSRPFISKRDFKDDMDILKHVL
jgi:hypothetical protein